MDPTPTLYLLGISLGLGLLVGLQRQRSASALAGFRTFPLVTVFGTLCALLGEQFGGWIIGLGLVALAGLIIVGNLVRLRGGDTDPGLTTETALLLMFGIGAYLPIGPRSVAVVLGAGVAVLLHLKPQMHALAARVGDQDFKAIMQFVVISLVVLPVLPDRTFGPYQVLNPHRIWLMVVLIVGISLAGYVVYKLFGARAGTVLAGLLGGLISSTATTVSYSRRAKTGPAVSPIAALVIALASTVVFGRVLLTIGIVAPETFRGLAPPLTAMLASATLGAGALLLTTRTGETGMPAQGNPTELKPALMFGGLFAVVLLAAAAAREHFGSRGLYVVGILSGLTDMDAITLSTAELVKDGQVAATTGWRVILLAAMSNLVFKAGVVAVVGGRALLKRVSLFFAVAFIAGVLILLFWPA